MIIRVDLAHNGHYDIDTGSGLTEEQSLHTVETWCRNEGITAFGMLIVDRTGQ